MGPLQKLDGVRLLVRRTRAARRRAVAAQVGPDLGGGSTALFLCATVHKARAVERRWWSRLDRPAAWLPEVEAWGSWVHKIAERWTDLPQEDHELCLERAGARIFEAHRSDFGPWSELPAVPSVYEALVALASEVRLAGGFGVLGFDDPSAAQGATADVVGDLRRWCGLWDVWVDRDGGRSDAARLRRGVAAVLADPPRELRLALRRWSAIVLDDLPEWTAADHAVLEHLAAAWRAERPSGAFVLSVAADVGDDDVADFAFGTERSPCPEARLSRPLRRRWAAAVEAGFVEVDTEAEAGPDLCRRWLGDEVVDIADLPACIAVRRYPTAVAEIEAVGWAFKRAILAGSAAEDFVLAVPALDEAVPRVRDIFGRMGVPWRLAKGSDLRTHPWVATARAVVAALVRLDPRSFAAVVSSPAIQWPAPSAELRQEARALLVGHPQAAGNIDWVDGWAGEDLAEERLLQAPVDVGGAARRLWGLLATTGRSTGDPRGWLEGLRRRQESKGQGSVVDDVLVEGGAAVLGLWDRLHVAERGPPGVFLRGARELCGTRVATSPDDPEVGPFAEVFWSLAEDCAAALERADGATPGGVDPQAIERWWGAVEEALPRTSVPTRAAGPAVQLVGLRDAVGVDIPFLWVAGLRDGSWPRTAPTPFLLPASVGRRVPVRDPGDEDRAGFCSLLRNAEAAGTALILSFAEGDGSAACAPLADLMAVRVRGGGVETTLGRWAASEQKRAEGAAGGPLSWDHWLRVSRDLPPPGRPTFREAVAHAQRVVAARSTTSPLGAWDGQLGDQGARWFRSRLRWADDGPYSVGVTRVERWATCPIRAWMGVGLGCDPGDEAAEEPAASETGSLVHMALQTLVTERIEAAVRGEIPTASLSGVSQGEFDALRVRLAAIVRARAPTDFCGREGAWSAVALERLVAGLDTPGFGPLRRWLEAERRRPLSVAPTEVEWVIPNLDAEAAATDLVGGPASGGPRVLVRGRADRVDRGVGLLTAVVWDYKTGSKVPSVQDAVTGTSFQPLVYAIAAARAGGATWPASFGGVAAGYLPLAHDLDKPPIIGGVEATRAVAAADLVKARGNNVVVVDGAQAAAHLRRLVAHVHAMAKGEAAPTSLGPSRGGCEHCPFSRACRVDHERMARVGKGMEAGT